MLQFLLLEGHRRPNKYENCSLNHTLLHITKQLFHVFLFQFRILMLMYLFSCNINSVTCLQRHQTLPGTLPIYNTSAVTSEIVTTWHLTLKSSDQRMNH